MNYEEAARLRDRIGALKHALEKQNVDWGGTQDQDVLGVYADDDRYQLCILFVRGGKLLGSKSFTPVKTKADVVKLFRQCCNSITMFRVAGRNYPSRNLPDETVCRMAVR